MAPLLRALQAKGSVHRVRTRAGDEAWLVTDYEEVRRLLNDDRLGMAHPDPDNAARASESALFGGRPPDNYETEHADRARFRRLLQPFFAPKRMRAFQPRVERMVTELLDGLAAGPVPADLHQALALPLPILVICELLGVPYEDRDRFRGWSQDAAALGDRQVSERGLAELWTYTRGLVERKRAQPADDVISGLCAAEDDALPVDEIAMLAAMILFAGHETTVVQIGYGAVLLLTNPDQHQAVLDDPALLPSAVEECLRVANVGAGNGMPRYPRMDIEVAGVTIPAGDLILLDIGAANHDAQVFADPHRLDITRNAGAHLSFGYGAHYCIGAPLARIELQAVFSRLIPRFPAMRLAVPIEELRLRDDLLTGGFREIPVTW
ncbi:cytochrome P450 [Sphaerisporangium flaviroseum]|uniref:Cytochrome P450 n=2 Tax=Sphaerisporangium flaviroseum TaxID=509199 RepID=A0ABP7HIB2_9ACTN